jgi:phosphatidylethanolamine-binding protein (PEBP) family uncharacterized protein
MLMAAISVVALAGCGSSGRTLRNPVPGATAPARKNTGSTASSSVLTGPGSTTGAVITGTALALSTTAWIAGQAIPKAYTCDGADTSPPLVISGAPSAAVELVLVVTDQTVSSQSLWLLAGIGPATPGIPQGGVPTGAIQIVNSSGTSQWSGPCPAPATGTHTYQFGLYALTNASGLTATSTLAQVNVAIASAISSSVISGTSSR